MTHNGKISAHYSHVCHFVSGFLSSANFHVYTSNKMFVSAHILCIFNHMESCSYATKTKTNTNRLRVINMSER